MGLHCLSSPFCLATSVQNFRPFTILMLFMPYDLYRAPIAQSEARPTADLGVTSSIPTRYHTFVEIYHEIISTVILVLHVDFSNYFPCSITKCNFLSALRQCVMHKKHNSALDIFGVITL